MKNITSKTLDKLSEDLKSEEQFKELNIELINAYNYSKIRYISGTFELSFQYQSYGGSKLSLSYPHIANIELSKEKIENIKTIILQSYNEQIQDNIKQSRKLLATEALGDYE